MTEPSISTSSQCFNLWAQPWIRVTRCDGRAVEVSLSDCLREAHTLYALNDPSPLVVGGTHRLLTAILQAIYMPESLDDIERILSAEAFDLARLDAFAAQYCDRFDLFHPTAPFLQTGDVVYKLHEAEGTPKPVASLFTEVPGSTYRAHFHHVTDDEHHVCPACCARGLITIPSFASSGGAGIYPSINGVPPVYVLPAGESLFQTLVLSLTAPNYQPALADPERSAIGVWNTATTIEKNQEISVVGYLESLVFPARRMRLFPEETGMHCTQCGSWTCIAVSKILFDMGHRRGKGAPTWDDPFVAFVQPGGRGKRDTAGPVAVRPQDGKALWREYSSLLLTHPDNPERQPKIVRQVSRLVDRTILDDLQLVRFRCIGMRTDGKAKIFEWFDESLEAPPDLLRDPDGALLVEDALHRAADAERVLNFVFDRHIRPERERDKPVKQELVRFKTLRDWMHATYWERLAPEFHTFVFSAADPRQREAEERRWIDTLVQVGIKTFRDTADQIGDRADALRARVEAQAACQLQLNKKRKEWLGDE
jgi:CRISPR system Cascade subunit CasA